MPDFSIFNLGLTLTFITFCSALSNVATLFLLLEKVLHPVVVHSDAKLRKLAETKGYLKPFR